MRMRKIGVDYNITCKFNFFDRGGHVCAHNSLAQFGVVMLILPHLFAQVFRPLWPFFAASGITYYLVSKAHDIGVRCASFYPISKSANSHPRPFSYPVSCFPF